MRVRRRVRSPSPPTATPAPKLLERVRAGAAHGGAHGSARPRTTCCCATQTTQHNARRGAQDPKQRATAEQVLRHPWMRENGVASDEPLDNVILGRMRNFSAMNHLKREALKFIASSMSTEEIAGLRAMFQVR